MFGNLANKLMTKISDKTRGGGSSPSASQGSPSHVGVENDVDEEETAEGFLCPKCMDKFISPEELESHYESKHGDDEQHVCPICKEKFPTGDQLQIHYAADHASSGVQTLNGDLQMLRNELAEMKTTLKEERWYSEELKKEVIKLGGVVEREETEESMSMKQQMKSLEEAKSLLSSEIVLLRKQLGEAVETHLLVKQQKEALEKKLDSFTSEKANILSQLDEEKCLRQQFEKDVDELKMTKSNLAAQLHENNEGEVQTLRKELVECKYMMDKLRADIEEERQKLLKEKSVLTQTLNELTGKFADKEASLNTVLDEMKSLRTALDEMKTEKDSALSQKLQLELQLSELSAETNKFKLEKVKDADATEKLEVDNLELKSELDNLQKMLTKQELQFNETKNKLTQAQKCLADERQNFNQQQQQFQTNIQDMEQKIKNLTADLNIRQSTIDKLLVNQKETDSHLQSTQFQLDNLNAELKTRSSLLDDNKIQLLDVKMNLEKELRLKQQIADRVSELQVEVDQKSGLVERLNQEREELYLKIDAGEGINAAIQQLQLENSGLLEKISNSQKLAAAEEEKSKKINEDLYASLLDTKRELEITREKGLKLVAALEEAATKLKTSEEARHQLQSNLSEKLKEFTDKENLWLSTKLELEKQLQTADEKLADNIQLLSKNKEDCSALETQISDLSEQLNQKITLVDELQAEIIAVKRKNSQLKQNLEIKEVEWKEQVCNVENIRSSLQQELAHLTIEKSTVDGELSKVRELVDKRVQKLSAELLDSRNTLSLLKSHVIAIQNMFNTESKAFEIKLGLLCSALVSTNQNLSAKKQSEINLLNQADKLNGIIAALHEEILKLKKTTNSVSDERDGWHRKQELTESSLNDYKSQCTELEKQLANTESTLKSSQSQLEQMTKLQEELSVKLTRLHDSEETFRNKLSESEQMRQSLDERLKGSSNDLAAALDIQKQLNLQKTSLETELFDSHKAYSDLEEKYSKMEVIKSDLENQIISLRNDLQNQISQLEEARDFLIAQKLDLSTKLTIVETELQKEKEANESVRNSSEQTVASLQNKIDNLNSLLSETTESKRVVEIEAEQTKARFEMQVTTLQENLSTLRGDVTIHQDKVKVLEARIDEIMGEKLETEAKLENAVDERRALLERCLSSEADCEKLRTATSELRKKFDDALSALHELGRENQTLQMETAKLCNRKWTDDAEVDHCLACQKMFSVTFRKHHCRNCGNIFCNECSSKSATITAYKKPVRVCDGCFNEINK
ncbi:early endosome antigen 1 [Chamberlinius hualienensis]